MSKHAIIVIVYICQEYLLQKISFFIIVFMSLVLQANASIKYKVKSGDTLYSIAHRNHTTVNKIVKLNGLHKHRTLKIGTILRIATNIKRKKEIKKRKQLTVDDILLSAVEKKNIYIFKSNKHKKVDVKIHVKNKQNNIIEIAKTKLGRRYVWGAVGQRGTFDCSGFTSYVYKKKGINIPRTSLRQSRYGKYIARRALKKGDLIFFDTSKRRKGYVNHVGIYIGNGEFIHASSAKKKVVVSKLSKFYAQRYVGARRPS